jgi:hypothetical protein
LGKIPEDGQLEIRDLGDGLNDKVYRGKVVHFHGRGKQGPSSIGGFSGETLLGDIFLKELVWREVQELAKSSNAPL